MVHAYRGLQIYDSTNTLQAAYASAVKVVLALVKNSEMFPMVQALEKWALKTHI